VAGACDVYRESLRIVRERDDGVVVAMDAGEQPRPLAQMLQQVLAYLLLYRAACDSSVFHRAAQGAERADRRIQHTGIL